ncbi:biotin--[acetyl-CoA-carboxylase] ligase [candidate division WOR-3 bacterium]|uniref:Biotin--[acetyl-CoA-carboxylase] ligase n=1 Tax=candidate division WOR-3 bacterium TaxID=2052148 RepID=A0A9D5KB43_UNCW3|nr:biotin--[acetyl-CoA-carboxylase] ligase [candidate division WOR-3 bacterium]MBD3364894.1 biotin--[acetyl-CoA-carboxylase] ligase [candidate division WOR-3 bacterium]
MKEPLEKLKSKLGLSYVEYYREVSSTQEAARRLNQTPPYLIVAKRQTRGKGRMGRRWLSENGGLYLTLVIERFPHEWAVSVTSAYLVLKSLSRNVEGITLKWPNDLLYGNAKLAGTLAEAWGGRLGVGVGVNVNQEGFGEALEGKATSLRIIMDRTFDMDDTLESISSALVNGLRTLAKKGFKGVYPGIRKALLESVQKVRVKTEKGEEAGRLLDIYPEGNVEIEIQGRRKVKLPAGQILGGHV